MPVSEPRPSPPAADAAAVAGGLFVAFEGGEGAGKSTQVSRLAQWLRERGHEVVVTFEPGDSALGRALREALLHADGPRPSPVAEALLFAADRAEHVTQVVRPALQRGAVVLTDRYAESSIAYQGGARGLGMDRVAELSDWATGGLRPDLTVLLDLPPRVGLDRFASPPDRMESEPLDFHGRVRAAFLQLAAADPDGHLVIDASAPVEQVAAQVRAGVEVLLERVRAPR